MRRVCFFADAVSLARVETRKAKHLLSAADVMPLLRRKNPGTVKKKGKVRQA